MGHAPHAILAYGHDLGAVHDFEGEPPAWYDETEGWLESAKVALMRAAGKEVKFAEYISHDELAMATGVDLIRHGDDVTDTYLLTSHAFETDWEGVKQVDMVLPDNADERLRWAIQTLDLNPDQTKPRWLLAAYLPG